MKISAASTRPAAPRPNSLPVLRLGSKGPAVEKLQRMLKQTGHNPGPVDGLFGPLTLAALKGFEKQQHIKVNGIVGAPTWNKLEEAAHRASSQPAARRSQGPSSADGKKDLGAPQGVTAKYLQLRDLVKARGGRFFTAPGQVNLIGFRTQNSTHTNGGAGVYNDQLIAVWRDKAGNPHFRNYKYNSEPAQDFAYAAADVNGDGRADMGRLRTGFFEYSVSSWKNGQPCLRPVRDSLVDRDMNHDGRFNDGRRTYGGASMLFHLGGSTSTWSAGCQTLPPSEWGRFWSDVRKAGGRIGYTLANR